MAAIDKNDHSESHPGAHQEHPPDCFCGAYHNGDGPCKWSKISELVEKCRKPLKRPDFRISKDVLRAALDSLGQGQGK